MEILAIILLTLSTLIGFVAIFFTNFGTTIIFSGILLYSLLTHFTIINLKILLILLVLYLLGELVEYLCIIVGAKKFGASNHAVIGAIVGGIVGALIGVSAFGIGVLPGTFIGIFLGASVIEFIIRRDIIKSLKAGAGSVLGRVGSIVIKCMIAIAMVIIILFQIF